MQLSIACTDLLNLDALGKSDPFVVSRLFVFVLHTVVLQYRYNSSVVVGVTIMDDFDTFDLMTLLTRRHSQYTVVVFPRAISLLALLYDALRHVTCSCCT